MDHDPETDYIKTTGTVFDIIDALRVEGSMSASEVADRLELARSTAYIHLQSLEACELVVAESNRYRLGLRLLDFGMAAKSTLPLSGVAGPILEELARKTEANVWLIVEEHGWAVYLDNAMGANAFSIESRVGEHSYLHALAAGKALLAHRPHAEVEAILEKRGLPRRTPYTLTDREAFLAELEAIRDREYAFSDEEDVEGVWGVGAPICDEDYAIGAVGVGAPANRFSTDYYRNELPNLLLGITNEIELKLAHE